MTTDNLEAKKKGQTILDLEHYVVIAVGPDMYLIREKPTGQYLPLYHDSALACEVAEMLNGWYDVDLVNDYIRFEV